MTALLFLLAASTPAPKPVMKPLAPIAACEIVTNAEVRAVFKRPFAKGAGDASSCEYGALEEQIVAIRMQHVIRKLDVAAEMLTLRKALPMARLRDAKGFSTPAFFMDLPGAGTQLFVIRGDHDFLLVTVLGIGEGKKVGPGAAHLAKIALTRLPSVD